MRQPIWLARLCAAVVTALLLGSAAACSEDATAPARLTIETAAGAAHFEVELADTDETRQRGLMFRETLAADAGMLFDFEETRIIYMWMRNTPLPLDMIFITAYGRIAHIAENTVPFSDTIISSRYPVASVFEVNAGTAAGLGIAVGDTVRHPLFGNAAPHPSPEQALELAPEQE